jgi:hypothetical protein
MALSAFILGGRTKADQSAEPPRQRRNAREASAPCFSTSHEGRQPGEVTDYEAGLVGTDGPERQAERTPTPPGHAGAVRRPPGLRCPVDRQARRSTARTVFAFPACTSDGTSTPQLRR